MSQHPSYRESSCSQDTRNPDDMLTRFAYDREIVLKSLATNPETFVKTLWNHDSPISIDRSCRFQMGTCHSGVCQAFFQCAPCRSLNRFLDLRRQGYLEVPFILPGRLVKSPLLLTRAPVPQANAKLLPDKTLVADEFTHNALVNFILDTELPVPHISSLHTIFICGDHGYLLYDYPTLGGVTELLSYNQMIDSRSDNPPTTSRLIDTAILKTEVVHQILMQLGALLKSLEPYHFRHGTPSLRHLLFSGNPCDYTYDQVAIKAPFTLKFIHFANSTMHWKSLNLAPNHRVKTRGNDGTSCQLITMASPHQLQALFDGRYHLDVIPDTRIPLYRLITAFTAPMPGTDGDSSGSEVTGSSEAPAGSLDLYCYLMGLLSEPYMYPAMMELKDLWEFLWLPDELDDLLKRLRDLHSRQPSDLQTANRSRVPKRTSALPTIKPGPLSYKELVLLLKGKHLRCNAVSEFWDHLKSSQD
jgi:hypothetical protein